ncbi:MAG: hypothetical protein SGI71_04140 [Verrucomicrobiota bacterium]|nr:hypothetical protein [Verrucomicrobiota bacterium]
MTFAHGQTPLSSSKSYWQAVDGNSATLDTAIVQFEKMPAPEEKAMFFGLLMLKGDKNGKPMLDRLAKDFQGNEEIMLIRARHFGMIKKYRKESDKVFGVLYENISENKTTLSKVSQQEVLLVAGRVVLDQDRKQDALEIWKYGIALGPQTRWALQMKRRILDVRP